MQLQSIGQFVWHGRRPHKTAVRQSPTTSSSIPPTGERVGQRTTTARRLPQLRPSLVSLTRRLISFGSVPQTRSALAHRPQWSLPFRGRRHYQVLHSTSLLARSISIPFHSRGLCQQQMAAQPLPTMSSSIRPTMGLAGQPLSTRLPLCAPSLLPNLSVARRIYSEFPLKIRRVLARRPNQRAHASPEFHPSRVALRTRLLALRMLQSDGVHQHPTAVRWSPTMSSSTPSTMARHGQHGPNHTATERCARSRA
ncbi:unannotated protein [freshwater metagenome]|uniref:Unannotated protein n=1 Tax=freshwater metagenome TaxID=449393 RepID=A0A6J6KP43_9ZZZZ